MKFEDFQKYYENDSDNIYNELNKLDEATLLEFINGERKDKYKIWEGKDNYQIWRVLKTKGTRKSINSLYKIISDLKNNYLIRYHACEALFTIARINDNDFKGEIQYGLNKDRQVIDRQKALIKLGNILKAFE